MRSVRLCQVRHHHLHMPTGAESSRVDQRTTILHTSSVHIASSLPVTQDTNGRHSQYKAKIHHFCSPNTEQQQNRARNLHIVQCIDQGSLISPKSICVHVFRIGAYFQCVGHDANPRIHSHGRCGCTLRFGCLSVKLGDRQR